MPKTAPADGVTPALLEQSFDLSALFGGRDLDTVLRAIVVAGKLLDQRPLAELERLAAADAGARRGSSPLPVEAELVAVDTPEQGAFRLRPENLIGRSQRCDLTLRSPKVSREHLRVVETETGHVLEDLGSANRTLLNGAPVLQAPLKHGDRIVVGDVALEYRVRRQGPGPRARAE